MGACPYPEISIIWVIMNVPPFAIAFLFGLAYLFTFKLSYIKVFIIMSMGYLIADKILKGILKGM
jgi:hypothetical protein